jgi:CHAT domain-containing protein
MERTEFVQQLLAADEQGRAVLLSHHAGPGGLPAGIDLAWALKARYDECESTDPALAATAAAALTSVAQAANDALISALATWTSGMAELDAGRWETASTRLALAREMFLACNQPLYAASTQISNLHSLIMLGRDDEAMQWGGWAHTLFAEAGDLLAIGKIEQNLAGLHFMRDRYVEAEHLFRNAHQRFATVGNQKQLIQVENNLATALTAQYKFGEAELFYEHALAQAEAGGFEVTVAEIECNLGCLALFRGRFDRALDYLERSRRRYAVLKMPHESAIADQEIADAYLELNLAPEAAAIYTRVTPLFAEWGMRAEQARALVYHGRACLLRNQLELAHLLLAEARMLYRALGNEVGEAIVLFHEAQAYFLENNFATAAAAAAQAEATLAPANAWGRLLQARWLRGEIARRQGSLHEARLLLENTLHDAQEQMIPQIAQHCLTSLGQLAIAAGAVVQGEAAFKQAIDLIEAMRAPLPAEEFRIAFFGDKLKPYSELVQLCLADGTPQRMAEALGYVERARARSLVDMLGDSRAAGQPPHDLFEAKLAARIETLREELNWFYSQINRPDSMNVRHGRSSLADLYEQVQVREATILDLIRQLQQHGSVRQADGAVFDLCQLQRSLGAETVLVEYFSLDERLLAFIVTDEQVSAVDLQCDEKDVQQALEKFHFQLGVMPYRGEHTVRHYATLVARISHHLGVLYDQLLRPLEPHLGKRRLLVAPHRTLHYVPFHALYDGQRYVIEHREVCYAPSAAVLHHCLATPKRPLQQAVLFGAPDEAAPRVYDEIATLAPLFPAVQTFLREQATRTMLIAEAAGADILHLACHGRFRADNPLFSALRLADGWLTVHDAARLNLRCNLVTLSACETGVSALAPGDELIGLARGFLLAGAPALLVSLWMVDDAATAQLMTHFYTQLLAGAGAAAALRHAQCQIRASQSHPFFWAPFFLFGRWS